MNGEGGAIAEEQRFNNLFDRVDTTSTTWLGLTMACAQCHDHKYDPMTRTDYYGLLDAFNRLPETGMPTALLRRIRVAPPMIELPSEENNAPARRTRGRDEGRESDAKPVIDAVYAAWKDGALRRRQAGRRRASCRGALTPLLLKPEAERTEPRRQSIESELRQHFDAEREGPSSSRICRRSWPRRPPRRPTSEYKGDQIPRVMVMSDDRPRETKILDRGDYLSPVGEKLTFLPPAFLPPLPRGLAAQPARPRAVALPARSIRSPRACR